MIKNIFNKISLKIFKTIIYNDTILKYIINIFHIFVYFFKITTLLKILYIFTTKPTNYIKPIHIQDVSKTDITVNTKVAIKKPNKTCIIHIHGGAFVFRIPYNIIKDEYKNILNYDIYYCTYPLIQETFNINNTLNTIYKELSTFIEIHDYNKFIFIGDSAGCPIMYHTVINLIDNKKLINNQIRMIFLSPFCLYPEVQFNRNNFDCEPKESNDFLSPYVFLTYLIKCLVQKIENKNNNEKTILFLTNEFGHPNFIKTEQKIQSYKLNIEILYGENESLAPSIKHFAKLYKLPIQNIKNGLHTLYFYKFPFVFKENKFCILDKQ